MSYVDDNEDSSSDDEMTEDPILQMVKTIIERHYLHTREPIAKIAEQLEICLSIGKSNGQIYSELKHACTLVNLISWSTASKTKLFSSIIRRQVTNQVKFKSIKHVINL